jgi:hypothetical protein
MIWVWGPIFSVAAAYTGTASSSWARRGFPAFRRAGFFLLDVFLEGIGPLALLECAF